VTDAYKDSSKSNASYFITLVHNIRGRWWGYGRGWTYLLYSYYILFLCNRQQQVSLIECCLTWNCAWSKGVSLNSSKMAPTDIHWRLLNIYGDQIVDVSKVKIGLHGQHFPSNEAVTAAVKQCVTTASAHFYKDDHALSWFIVDENA